MGGDSGSAELVAGAVLAVAARDLRVTLVGDETILAHELRPHGSHPGVAQCIDIVHAPEVVAMDESPIEALRKKKNSSIAVSFSLLKKKEVDAVVSAGNSGATMAAAVRNLGRLPNVSRPGIASVFPTLRQPMVMMDVGANVDCRPLHLYQFAVMASAFSRMMFNIERPRVGLLSIGEEAGKGNILVKKTHALLSDSDLNYVGNVEGRDCFKGDVHVVVCDGFVGNICLKLSEGLAGAVLAMLKHELSQTLSARIGAILSRKAFVNLRKVIDYAEYGGAPLLGLNGIGIVCHGKSSPMAIANALNVSARMVRSGVCATIAEMMENSVVEEQDGDHGTEEADG